MARTPRFSGRALSAIAKIARTRAGGAAMSRALRAELGIDSLKVLPEALRGDVPLDTRAVQGRPPRRGEDAKLPHPNPPWSVTTETLGRAYREGHVTPRDAVERSIAAARALATRRPSVGPFCDYAGEIALSDADAALDRIRRGVAKSEIDGVVYAVKEQTAVRGFPRRGGTAFVSSAPMLEDATCTKRLRDAGAIVVGMTMMTEYGMTPNGANAKRLMPRNPHARDRMAGGSSTGSGVAVATGVVPFAMGADGGGSIRIPSAMNGVFGIKPTWGRISRTGDMFTGSVAHVGPLASSTLDLARVLEFSSGRDETDPETFAAPPHERGQFVRAIGRGVRGLTVGVIDSEWDHADKDIARAGKEAISALEKEGAKILRIDSELARHAAGIGYVTISIEARAALRDEWRLHADEMTDDLQVTLSSLDAFTAIEYVEAQRLRTGLRREMARIFESIDVLAMPTTVSTAAQVSDTDMRTGFLDASVIDGLCRFVFMGNLTGLPAMSCPVGRDSHGLPIGLQLVGDAWDEATVLATSAHLERIGVARVDRPEASVSIL